MEVVIFDDEHGSAMSLSSGVSKMAKDRRASVSVKVVSRDFFKEANSLIGQGGQNQVWLVDLKTRYLEDEDNEKLKYIIEEERSNDPRFRQLSNEIMQSQEGPFGGLALLLMARKHGIKFRLCSHLASFDLPLMSYMFGLDDRQYPKVEELGFVKSTLMSLYPTAPDVRPEYERLLDWIEGRQTESGWLKGLWSRVRGVSGKWWAAIAALVALLAGLTRIDEYREMFFPPKLVVESFDANASGSGTKIETIVTSMGVVRAGEEFQLVVKLNDDAFVHVLILDRDGRIKNPGGYYEVRRNVNTVLPYGSTHSYTVSSGKASGVGFFILAQRSNAPQAELVAAKLDTLWDQRILVRDAWRIGRDVPITRLGSKSESEETAEEKQFFRQLMQLESELDGKCFETWQVVIFPVR